VGALSTLEEMCIFIATNEHTTGWGEEAKKKPNNPLFTGKSTLCVYNLMNLSYIVFAKSV
jgi:hypothetical protein